MTFPEPITFSAGNGHLDRAAHLRRQAAELLAAGEARLAILCEGRLLIDLRGKTPALGWLVPERRFLDRGAGPAVFLGLIGGRPSFAVEWPAAEDAAEAVPEGFKFIDLRSIAGELSPGEASVAATAKGVWSWHLSHPRCARCGEPTGMEDGGWRRRCGACGGLHFPRTDPVVIMLITEGDDVLLGRQSLWPEGLHSLLAGFMEPGETIEEAVRREVFEETQIEVGDVRYLACQPWPFPSSLMLGCAGHALGREITIDPTELESARWVSRDEMRAILAGEHSGYMSPRVDAIARSILTAWVRGEIEGF